MVDTYMEHLVKKKAESKDIALRVAGWFLTVLSLPLGLMIDPLLFLVTLALFFVTKYLIYPATDLEYEYLYCDKVLSVDKILAKESRKKVAEYELDRIEIIAPANSPRLVEYNKKELKTINLWSLDDSDGHVPMVVIYEGNQKIVLDLPIEFVKIIQNNAPRKVFLD